MDPACALVCSPLSALFLLDFIIKLTALQHRINPLKAYCAQPRISHPLSKRTNSNTFVKIQSIRFTSAPSLLRGTVRSSSYSVLRTSSLRRQRFIHQSSVRLSFLQRLAKLISPSPPSATAKAATPVTVKMASPEEQLSPIPPPPAKYKLDASAKPLVWIDCE